MTALRHWTLSLFSLLLLLLGATAQASDYITFIHSDPQGSPVMATDEQGNVVWQEEYEPWGGRQVKDPVSATASRGSDVWYTGKEEEAALGMYYYGARWYSPGVGAFAAIDPAAVSLENPRSFNRYVYANNNPVRYVDPNGESPVDVAFLLYDVGKFGMAVYSGAGVGAAAVDVGLSVLGVLSPVPGTGQMLKTARTAERAADLARAADHGRDAKRALEGAEQAAKGCCCFVAGTPVLTEGGLKAIETLKVGDQVPSKDTASGKISLQKISKVFITQDKPLYELTLKNAQGEQEVLQVTDNHPFWVVSQGWVDSAKLQQGLVLEGKQGLLTVASLRALGRTEPTYNLTVDGNHNYFASKQLALVHNCTCTSAGTKPLLGNEATKRVKKDRTLTDLDPVQDRATAKSIFRNQSQGKKVQQRVEEDGSIRRWAEDKTQIRMKPDGATSVDLPGRGTQPNGETIHFSGE